PSCPALGRRVTVPVAAATVVQVDWRHQAERSPPVPPVGSYPGVGLGVGVGSGVGLGGGTGDGGGVGDAGGGGAGVGSGLPVGVGPGVGPGVAVGVGPGVGPDVGPGVALGVGVGGTTVSFGMLMLVTLVLAVLPAWSVQVPVAVWLLPAVLTVVVT